MKIDDLTIGEAKQLAAMFQSAVPQMPQQYAPIPPVSGRAVVVVDRGWIFAGDMSMTLDGYLRLDKAVHVFKWQEIGFSRVIKEWRDGKVDVRSCDSVEIPMASVIFRVPVEAGWGVK